MILTPVMAPPAPGSITELSPLAVKMLAFLKRKSEEELDELTRRPLLVDKFNFTRIKSEVCRASEDFLGKRSSCIPAAEAYEKWSPNRGQIVSEYFSRNETSLKHAFDSGSTVSSKRETKSPTKQSDLFLSKEGRFRSPEKRTGPACSTPTALRSSSLNSPCENQLSSYFGNIASFNEHADQKKPRDAVSFGRLRLKCPKTLPRHNDVVTVASLKSLVDRVEQPVNNISSVSPRQVVLTTPSLQPLLSTSCFPSVTTPASPVLPSSSKAPKTYEPTLVVCYPGKMPEECQELTESVIQSVLLSNIVEICFTICYKEGFSLLNTPAKGTKCLCTPSGILLKITKDESSESPIYGFLHETKLKEAIFKDFLLNLLNFKCRKACFDSQTFIIYVIDKAQLSDKKAVYDWLLIDPMIAFWLIDPDRPPMTFQNLISFLSHLSWDLSNVCRLLDCLSQAVEALYLKLNRLNLWSIFFQLETKITPIIAVMECASIVIDYAQLDALSVLLAERMKSLERMAWQSNGGNNFNLNSSVQLSKVLYDELKLDAKAGILVPTTGVTKVKSTAEATLKLLDKYHKLPRIIMEYRKLQKIKSAYLDGIAARVINNKYISTTWEQCAAATGRLVSSDPNLQAIPKTPISFEGTTTVVNLRKPYQPRKGFRFVAADFEQIELRIIAHLANDARLVEAFKQSDDVFTSITRMRLAMSEITLAERNQTKTLVYALVYGAGVNKIADILSLDKESAVKTCERLYTLFPQLKQFRQKVIQDCLKNKYLTSVGGRRRVFPQIGDPDPKIRFRTERQAVNFIIQGSAADVCKAAMVSAEYALRQQGVNSRLLLQIHDELLWEVPENDIENAKGLIKQTIEARSTDFFRKLSLQVPLPVKITSGPNWGEMDD